MKVELSEQDVSNTVEFLSRAPIKGAESFVMAILIQTFRLALQPSEPDGPNPADNSTGPKEAKAEKK